MQFGTVLANEIFFVMKLACQDVELWVELDEGLFFFVFLLSRVAGHLQKHASHSESAIKCHMGQEDCMAYADKTSLGGMQGLGLPLCFQGPYIGP